MFAAELTSTRTTVALAGASAVELVGAQLVDVVTASALARAGELQCRDPHCDAALLYNNGAADLDGNLTRRPHWRHPAGAGMDCAASGGPEGEWHQMVKLGLLGAAESHEMVTDDGRARCDAVIRRKGGSGCTAVEVQHSSIAAATIPGAMRRIRPPVWKALFGSSTARGLLPTPTWPAGPIPMSCTPAAAPHAA